MQQRQHLLEMAQKQLGLAFKKFDYDNSGQLEKSQFVQFFKRVASTFGAQDPSNQEAEQIWKEIDLNGDGKLSKMEFDCLIEDIVEVICEDQRMSKKFSSGEVDLSN